MRKTAKPFWRHTIEWIVALSATLGILWAVHQYVGEVYRVRLSNQSGGYSKGTLLWVDKWNPGSRSSFNHLHYPTVYFGSGQANRFYKRAKQLDVSRYDLVIFNHIYPDSLAPDLRLKMLNRLIGLPGDTIRLYNGKLYINGKAIEPSAQTIVHFEAQLSDSTNLTNLEFKYNLSDARWTRGRTFQFSAHPSDALRIAGDSLVIHFSRLVEIVPDTKIFTTGIGGQNGDNFGPVVLPWRGMPATPDPTSPFAGRLWNDYEIQGINQPYFVNDTIPAFANNYYFMLSDYRKMGNDSRYYGAIPEYLIIGKVASTLWNSKSSEL